jgi:hypothetical protein
MTRENKVSDIPEFDLQNGESPVNPVFAAYFVFRSQQKFLNAMAVEVRERKAAEEALIKTSGEVVAARDEVDIYLNIRLTTSGTQTTSPACTPTS